MSNNITFILPIFNEEDRIKRVCEYYQDFGELIVIDSYSTDNSLKIVNKLNIKSFQFQNNGTHQTPEFYKFIKEICSNKYIVLLSASEFIPRRLIKKYMDVANSGSHSIVSSVVDSYTCGEAIPLWGGRFKFLERRIERFFNIDLLDIDNIFIHKPYSTIDNNILLIENSEEMNIKHIRDADTYSLLKKHIGYSQVEAHHIVNSKKSFSILKCLYLTIKEIFRFFHLPITKWHFISHREIFARIVMHWTIYYSYRELIEEKDMKYSINESEKLWKELTRNELNKNG